MGYIHESERKRDRERERPRSIERARARARERARERECVIYLGTPRILTGAPCSRHFLLSLSSHHLLSLRRIMTIASVSGAQKPREACPTRGSMCPPPLSAPPTSLTTRSRCCIFHGVHVHIWVWRLPPPPPPPPGSLLPRPRLLFTCISAGGTKCAQPPPSLLAVPPRCLLLLLPGLSKQISILPVGNGQWRGLGPRTPVSLVQLSTITC